MDSLIQHELRKDEVHVRILTLVETVRFNEWLIEFDRERTREGYEQSREYSAKDCGCAGCLNWIAAWPEGVPDEVRKLFMTLGVDPRKPAEVYDMGDPLEDGSMWHGGWYTFFGKLLEGPDSYDAGRRIPDSSEGSSRFQLGFTSHISFGHSKSTAELLQLEFIARLPWRADPALLEFRRSI